METFIKVYFWLSMGGIVLRLCCIGLLPYPRSTTIREDCITAIVATPFLIWSAILLWA